MVKSMTRWKVWLGIGLLLLAPPALAQDDPIFEDDDEIDFDPAPPVESDDDEQEGGGTDPAEEPDPDTLDFRDPEDGTDLLGEEPDAAPIEGGDTAAIYRMTLEEGRSLDPDEELQLWDAYLERYPNTAFREQIDARRAELEEALYRFDRLGKDDASAEQAPRFTFTQGVLLENINPRNRVLALVEWGLPDYASLSLDLEQELRDRFSVHGGFRRRFTGFSVEAGARYAFVRSPRTQTLLTGSFDVRLNASPAFIAFRPMVGFGKRFDRLDLQAQIGAELAPRQIFDVRIIGGFNAKYHATEAVGLFTETAIYLHTVSAAAGPFRFNQFVFGMSFLPMQKSPDPEKVEVTLATTLPFTSAYWQFHYGSVVAQLVVAL